MRGVALAALAVLVGCFDAPQHRPGCLGLVGQWEQTSYRVSPEALQDTAPEVVVDGPADPATVAALVDAVEACVLALDAAPPGCYPRAAWGLQRRCTVVKVVPGELACSAPVEVLPDHAPAESCAEKDTPPQCAQAPCRWRVATQDDGRTIVVPPALEALPEAVVRVATGCRYPWRSPELARCSAPLR